MPIESLPLHGGAGRRGRRRGPPGRLRPAPPPAHPRRGAGGRLPPVRLRPGARARPRRLGAQRFARRRDRSRRPAPPARVVRRADRGGEAGAGDSALGRRSNGCPPRDITVSRSARARRGPARAPSFFRTSRPAPSAAASSSRRTTADSTTRSPTARAAGRASPSFSACPTTGRRRRCAVSSSARPAAPSTRTRPAAAFTPSRTPVPTADPSCAR